ncbi:MAG: hypothetical protein ABFD07_15385, partial [Methanobacterium sp.]
MIFDYIEEYLWNITPNPYKIVLIVCILFIIIVHKYSDKYSIANIQNYIKQYKEKSPKKFFSIIVVIILTFAYCGYYYVNENYVFHEPPQDRFLISISPFYLDDSKVDLDTAEELKEKIETTTNGRIKATVLKEPAIKDDKEAVLRGQKAGAHLVVYGGQRRKLGDINDIEFHIVPIDSQTMLLQSIALNITDTVNFKATFCPYSEDPILIVESLTQNVSSTVFALCALEYYKDSDFISAIQMFKSIKNYESKGVILQYIADCYFYDGEFNKSLLYINKASEVY